MSLRSARTYDDGAAWTKRIGGTRRLSAVKPDMPKANGGKWSSIALWVKAPQHVVGAEPEVLGVSALRVVGGSYRWKLCRDQPSTVRRLDVKVL